MKYLLPLIFLTACTTPYKGPTTKLVRENLIPYGTYNQRVDLTILANNGNLERQFSFNGILRIDRDKILVIALSPFGTTEFKLEDSGKEIKTEIYRDGMKKAEAKIRDYYLVLRALLRARQSVDAEKVLVWEEVDALGLPVILRNGGATFRVNQYDERSVPVGISIFSSAFRVDIKVTEYEEN